MGKDQKYISRRLKLAESKLKVAKLLFRHSEYRDAISRAYYAMFHGAKAFLLQHGQDPVSHKGVRVLLHQFCAKGQELEPAFAQMLSTVQEGRIEAEYDEMSHIGSKDARQALELAETFVKKIKKLLR